LVLPRKPPNKICGAVLIASISKIQKYFYQNLSLLVVPKLSKLSNQPKMSWFCPGNPRTGFVVQILSFSISTAPKYVGQNFVTFGSTKTCQTCQTCKPTQNELVLPPKPPNMICSPRFIVFHQYDPKYFGQNFVTFGSTKSFQTCQTCKPTQNEWVLTPKPPNMICGAILIVLYQYDPKIFRLKLSHLSWFFSQNPEK